MSVIPWVIDARARALEALGRYDEALALLREAREESKQDLVSHALNLANLLAELNRPQEALAALPPLDSASAYGHVVAAGVQVMAAAESEDRAGLDAALALLRAQERDNPRSLVEALVIAGRDDEAAAELVARLADPHRRSDALVDLQDYADHPAPALVTGWRQRLLALRARPDVHRAVEACGRIRSYPIAGVVF
jgi:tetratricopeptide (TPR) repeat protein